MMHALPPNDAMLDALFVLRCDGYVGSTLAELRIW